MQRDFPADVSEIILSGRLNRCPYPFYRKSDKADRDEKMEMLGISGLKNKCYRDLSGGQQQRVLLARALCSAGKLLILDEPAAGLDPAMTEELYPLIRRCIKKYNLAVIMVSHDIESTLAEADHILHLSKGKQIFYGTAEEYAATAESPLFTGGLS